MGFHYGTNSLPGFVAELASELAATEDFAIYDADAVGGYCLRYKDQDLYMLIEIVAEGYISVVASSGTRFVGVGIRFSTAWDSESHVPSGTIRRWALAPLFCQQSPPSTVRLGADASFQINYWVDRYGFVGVVQNPYTESSDPSGAVFACEFLPTAAMEYSDGYTGVMAYTKRNHPYWVNASYKATAGSAISYYHCLHLFGAVETPDSSILEGALRYAIRSNGNSKIYFSFPTYENDLSGWRAPIAQSKRWFFVDGAGGLSPNDIVAWLDPADGVTVRKFFVTAATSPDSGAQVIVAIPYENAYQY